MQNGRYPLAVPLGIVWKGDLKDLAERFVNFLLSPEGEKIIIQNGAVSVDQKKNTMFKSIKTELISSHLGVIFLAALILGSLSYLIMNKQLQDAQISHLSFIGEYSSHNMSNFLERKSNILERISMGKEIEKYGRAYQELQLIEVFSKFKKEFSMLCYINKEGCEEVKMIKGQPVVNGLQDISKSSYFNKALKAVDKAVIFPPEKSAILDEVVIKMALTRYSYFGDEFIGMVMGAVPFKEFSEELAKIKVGKSGFINVINDQGIILAHPYEDQIGRTITGQGKTAQQLIAKAKAMEKGVMRATISGIDGFIAYAPAKDLGCSLLVTLPYEEYMVALNKLRDAFLFIFIGICIIGWIVSKFLAAGITEPIMQLTKHAYDISTGNFFQFQIKKIKAKYEIGDLVASFNRMAEDLDKTSVSKNYTDNIINAMKDALIVVYADGYIISVNVTTCNLLGYKKEELIGRSIEDILVEGARLFKETGPEGQKEMASVDNIDITLVSKQGTKIPVLFSSSTMLDDNGYIQGIVCLALDITELKQAQDKLKSLNESLEQKVIERTLELEQSNKELEQFAYIASHDLQEPLRKVITFGDRLQEKYAAELGEQGKDYLGRMRRAAQRMQQLINDLLKYSRASTKVQSFVPVNLAQVVQGVLSDLEVLIEENKARILVESLPTIEADSLQMRQLLQNLISNGLKFHRKEEYPTIVISAKTTKNTNNTSYGETLPDDGFLEIAIEDNGIGFDEKYAHRIFEVFQRLHGRDEYEGTGIGLSVCKKIVGRHKGDIKVKSIVGQGTTFMVTLPLVQVKEKKVEMNY